MPTSIPTGEIEFESIQRIFAQRDARLAAEAKEASRQRTSGHKSGSHSKSASGSSSRSGSVSRSRDAHSVNSRTTKRLPDDSNRARLERTPRQDEYRRTTASSRSGGARAASSGASRSRGKHTKRNGVDAKKAGTLVGSLAGVITAICVAIGTLSSPSPAQGSAKSTDAQKANLYSGITSYVNAYEGEDIDIEKITDGDYVIDFDKHTADTEGDINTENITKTTETSNTPLDTAEHVTDNVLEAIKNWEDFKPNAYRCPSNKLTIGWGHTDGVYEGQTTTREEAGEFLREDIVYSENVVKDYAAKFGVILTQGQLDALTSFAFNCGEGTFRNSGLIETLAEEGIDATADLMKKFVYGTQNGEKVEMAGLVTRRETEASWLYN